MVQGIKIISGLIFEKNALISYFMKILPLRAEFFLADGQTDMTKLIVAFFGILRTRLITNSTQIEQ
jgi:hypothetical protein